MNTTPLKKFAQQARRKLLEQVAARLDYVLQTDSAELREKAGQIKKLQEAINRSSREQVIEKVAYTWFNRLMALRFMDANDYQPLGVKIVSPKPGYTLPEILDDAKQGNIPDGLPVNQQHIYDLLDGKLPAANPQNEAYKALLTGACNHLNQVFPFLFERINDHTELLLPDDLTSEFSIVEDVRRGMTDDDCREVEIIGWLYQFYISEKKDEVFASKSKVKKEDIPAATQLFTPRWIVEYMVQNTLGKLWLQNRPDSGLCKHMPYFIESPSLKTENYLKINSPEEITLLDSACGSGHILVYAFELLTKIYEEEGYNPGEIPQLIIEKNLYGFEIDERAAQLAGFALMMKARSYHRRFFRKEAKPNILCFNDLKLDDSEIKSVSEQTKLRFPDSLLKDLVWMQQATNLGSLIQPQTPQGELERIKEELNAHYTTGDIFLKQQIGELLLAIEQLLLLSKKYHCIVDNPPYMGGGKMNKELSDFVKKYYPKSKADLFSCFIERSLEFLPENGFTGLVTMESWMFLSSFEGFRKYLLENTKILSLSHFGWHIMRIAFGTVSFILEKAKPEAEFKGVYSYMEIDNIDKETDRPIVFPVKDNGRYKTANQKDFTKIPGSPIGYWLSERFINVFQSATPLGEVAKPRQGMATSNNNRFIRLWFEVQIKKVGFNYANTKDAKISRLKWFPYNKGGERRKWYGNQEFIVNWFDDGKEIMQFAAQLYGSATRTIKNIDFYFKEAITWSFISSSGFSVRYTPKGFLFDVGGSSAFPQNNDVFYLSSLLCSKIATESLKVIAPTINFQAGDIKKIPILSNLINDYVLIEITQQSVFISQQEWDSRETSWDFTRNELLRVAGEMADGEQPENQSPITNHQPPITIEQAYKHYKHYWQAQFYQLHQNEEELNKQFIEIYGLQEELTPDVPLEDITILKDELDQKALKKLSDSYRSGWKLVDGEWELVSGEWKMVNGEQKMVNGEQNELNANPQSPITNHQSLITNPQSPITNHYPPLPFNAYEIIRQFISYAVGCMFGRYSLDHTGLHIADTGMSLEEANKKFNIQHSTFDIDTDNIIPVLDDEWFEDDIVNRFKTFLRVTFGKENFERNLAFVEDALGKDIRKYFVKDFYTDHIRRYKKRPIYWMFSSPKGAFNVLIYMHRYTPDTLNLILNNYLREYREKLNVTLENLEHILITGTPAEQTKASRQKDKLKAILNELQEYERDIFYPLAAERISIDLDDGVLVNYNKFGKAIKQVAGLNDPKTKKKVKGFDWIDNTKIK